MIDLFYLIISFAMSSIALIASVSLLRSSPNYPRSLLVAFLATMANYFLPLVYIPMPYSSIILGVLVWVILIKLFLRISWEHSITIGMLAYGINFALEIIGIPGLIRLVTGF